MPQNASGTLPRLPAGPLESRSMMPVPVARMIQKAKLIATTIIGVSLARDHRGHNAEDQGQRHRNAQLSHQRGQVLLFPARHRCDRHQEQDRQHQRDEYGIEVRRSDGDLAETQGVQKQGVERSQQDRTRRNRQQHVVGQQQRSRARAARNFHRAPPSEHAKRTVQANRR